MANQKPSPRQEKQSTRHTEPERKPRKRERRIHQRLQKAQQAHDKALERVRRAEAQLQKRQARVQRIEEHLTLLRRQSGELSNSSSTLENAPGSEPLSQQELLAAELQAAAAEPAEASEDVRQEQELLAEELRVGATAPSENPIPVSTGETSATAQSNQDDQEGIAQEETTPASPSSLAPAEATGFAKIARAVAESTERAARMAMARALEVANRLEQMSSGRHLEQELLQTEAEADEAHAVAQKAEHDAEEAERLERLATGFEEPQATPATTQAGELLQENQSPLQTEEEPQVPPLVSQAGELPQEAQIPTPLEEVEHEEQPAFSSSLPVNDASIEEIEEEEEVVAAVAAIMIADVAAAAAAEAEALAEASSARTREARHGALQAGQALGEVRLAISR